MSCSSVQCRRRLDFTPVQHRIGRCLWTPVTQFMPQHAALGACLARKKKPPSPPPPSYTMTWLFLSLSIDIDHVRGEHAIQVHRICACHAEFTHQSIITRCFSVILLGFVLIVLIVIIVSSMTPITVMRETATTHTYSFPSPSSSRPPPSVAPLGWTLRADIWASLRHGNVALPRDRPMQANRRLG